MPISKDLIAEAKRQNAAAMAAAVKSGDEQQIADAFASLCNDIHDAVLQNAAMDVATAQRDATVMAARGVRQLTSPEQDYYKGLAAMMAGRDPKMELTGWTGIMPLTIVDQVMEDLRRDHPLLDLLDMVNSSYLTRYVMNAQPGQTAKWGPINEAITKELNGAFKTVDVTLMKLTAYMAIPQDMLDLGPQYIDSYVRAILSESIAASVEVAVVNGTGNNEPIGMTRDVSASASVVGNVQPLQTAQKVTELSAEQLGKIVAMIARTPGEPTKPRPVSGLALIVNPFDYWEKILPATSYRRPDGSYINDVLPIPAKIVEAMGLDKGQAILGIPKRYLLLLGVRGKNGTIETSDEAKFLEDLRLYKAKFQGNGLPKDEYSFVLLNIADLKPTVLKVDNVGK